MTSYSQTGGVRIGAGLILAFNASWPLASIHVDEAALSVSCLGRRWVFPKASIRRLSKHRGLFSTGLRIEHTIDGYPEFLAFWTCQFGHLKEALEERGYAVSASADDAS